MRRIFFHRYGRGDKHLFLKKRSYYLSLSVIDKYVPAVLCGEKVSKRGMVISQPILISPLPSRLFPAGEKY